MMWSRGTRAAVLAGIVGAGMLLSVRGAAHPSGAVTWSTAARILEERCVMCHGGEGSTEPRLDGYDHARQSAGAIKRAVLERRMPPWYAVEGFGDFADDPTLSPMEIGWLADWVDSGAPKDAVNAGETDAGTGATTASQQPDVTSNHSHEPVLVLRAPKHQIDGPSHTFALPTRLADDRWIRGWEIRPGNPSLVIGAVASIAPGITLATWTPGEGKTRLPDGIATRLPRQSTVLLTVQYRRTSAPAVDESSIAFFLSERPRRQLRTLHLPCGSLRVPRGIEALAVRPAPGLSGESLTVVARRPDRSVEPLGWFRNYPGRHDRTYWFRRPMILPAGTSISVAGSDANCGAELEYVSAGDPVRAGVQGESSAPLRQGFGGQAYACPMHPQVRSDRPGTCPGCGMTLVDMTTAERGKYSIDLAWAPRAVRPGQPATLRLFVERPPPLTLRRPGPRTNAIIREFEVVHERPFHLFVVSRDLDHFAHLHPALRADGAMEVTMTLPRAGAYQLYADFLPAGGLPQLVQKSVITAGFTAFAGARAIDRSPVFTSETREGSDRGLRMRIEPGRLVAGRLEVLACVLEDAQTRLPITDLEPYLGAWGHALIVSSDLADAVHSHPVTPLTSPGGPRIFFSQRFPKPGFYRMWIQVQRRGEVATIPFTLAVEPL